MVVMTKDDSDDPTAKDTAAEVTEEVRISDAEPPVTEGTVGDGDLAVGDAAVGDAAEGDAADEYDDADTPVGAELDWVGTDAPARVGGAKRRALIGGVAALLVALLAATVVLGVMQWRTHRLDTAREQLQRAAVAYALVLTSIDSNKVDENFDQVLDGATGEFKDMYAESSEKLRQLLIDNKATAHGQVVESAVQSVGNDEGVVLLFIDQAVSNTNVPDPRLDRSRMKMTMKYVDGRWRASKVELP